MARRIEYITNLPDTEIIILVSEGEGKYDNLITSDLHLEENCPANCNKGYLILSNSQVILCPFCSLNSIEIIEG